MSVNGIEFEMIAMRPSGMLGFSFCKLDLYFSRIDKFDAKKYQKRNIKRSRSDYCY